MPSPRSCSWSLPSHVLRRAPGSSSTSSSPADGTISPVPSASPTAASPSPMATATPTPRPTPRPTMNARAALRDIVHLASDIGPREATSGNYAEAAEFVQARFERLGYEVRRTRVPVPSGNSWGTPVRRGTSLNVIAEPKGFDSKEPHVVIGAHLDTVPVAPGAEDNASGVAVMLQLAAMVSQQPTALPVQFIAFGAEEPRGSGDALHHFGSRQHVADLSALGASRGPGDGVSRSGRRTRQLRADLHCNRRWQPAPGCHAGGGAASRHTHAGMHELHQRPLVICKGRRSRRPTRQHPLRRLPLPRRRTERCRPPPARSGWPDGVGVVADSGLTAAHILTGQTVRGCCPTRRRGCLAARSPRTSRGVKAPSITYGTGSTAFTAPPQSTISKKMPSRVLVWKSMSKMKLPSECTTTADPAISKPWTQCGCPPITRSAPASAKARAATRWLDSGTMRVLGAPVCEHHDDVNPLAERSDVRADPLELRAVQRAGARWHVEPIGAGPGAWWPPASRRWSRRPGSRSVRRPAR